jgi:hypothetical protein
MASSNLALPNDQGRTGALSDHRHRALRDHVRGSGAEPAEAVRDRTARERVGPRLRSLNRRSARYERGSYFKGLTRACPAAHRARSAANGRQLMEE